MSTIKLRRDTAANWTAANPVLGLAEPGLETDTFKIKYGDGQTAWNNLPYPVGINYWNQSQPGDGCPTYAQLTTSSFIASTQQSHIDLYVDSSWDIGSRVMGTGVGADTNGNMYAYVDHTSTSTFSVYTGAYAENTWTFAGDGSLTLPTMGSIKFSDGSIQKSAFAQPIDPRTWIQLASTASNLTIESSTATNYSQTQAIAYDNEGNALALVGQGAWYNSDPFDVYVSTVVKFDPTGGIIWSRDFTDGNSINPWSLTVDIHNNIYIILQQYNPSSPNYNILIKLNGADGSILWEKTIIQTQNENNMQAIAYYDPMIGDGVVFAGSEYNSITDTNEFLIAQVSGDGSSFLVTNRLGGQYDESAYGLAINPSTEEVVFVGALTTGTGHYYCEVIKIAEGGITWQRTINADQNYDMEGVDVALLPDGNWAVVAYHQLPVNGVTQYGMTTMKISNTDGSIIWSREIANGCVNLATSIATDSAGNIYISGSTWNGVFGGGETAPTSRIIGAYDINGNIIWQQMFGADSDHYIIDMNWWNGIGNSGKTIASYGDRLLLGGFVAPWVTTTTTSYASITYSIVAQIPKMAESLNIGEFHLRSSNIADNVVTLQTNTASNITLSTSSTTFSISSPVSSIPGSLVFSTQYGASNIALTPTANHYINTTSSSLYNATPINVNSDKVFLTAYPGGGASYVIGNGVYDGQTITFLPDFNGPVSASDLQNVYVYTNRLFSFNSSSGIYQHGNSYFPWYPFSAIAQSLATPEGRLTWNANLNVWIPNPYNYD